MRTVYVFALLVASLQSEASLAASVSREDAIELVRSAGYRLVSKTDAAPGLWDVWASKDGISYKVQVDASNGALIAAFPVEVDD